LTRIFNQRLVIQEKTETAELGRSQSWIHILFKILPGEIQMLNLVEKMRVNIIQALNRVAGQAEVNQLAQVHMVWKGELKKIVEDMELKCLKLVFQPRFISN
jgi:hypothetical protein